MRSIDSLVRKDTRGGNPFYTKIFADSTGRLTPRAWGDALAFDFCEHGEAG